MRSRDQDARILPVECETRVIVMHFMSALLGLSYCVFSLFFQILIPRGIVCVISPHRFPRNRSRASTMKRCMIPEYSWQMTSRLALALPNRHSRGIKDDEDYVKSIERSHIAEGLTKGRYCENTIGNYTHFQKGQLIFRERPRQQILTDLRSK